MAKLLTFLPRASPLVALVAVLALSSSANADAPQDDDAVAAELKNQGNDEMNALNYVRALEVYDQALSRAKDATLRASLIYNKGRTFQAMGNYPRALEELETFDKVAPPELKGKVVGFAALLEDVRDRVAIVAITCSVLGAEIRVGERVLDTCRAAVTELRLNSGKSHIEVRREGYIPFAVDLDLKGRQVHALTATLVANVSKGTLRVESVPGAFVRLDNKDLGPVPQDATLDPGNHMIELRKSGFEPMKKSVLVIAGQRHLIKVDELATPPFTNSVAFWGLLGGGVALVGGAIVGFVVASNSEKTPGTGSLPPGRIYTGGVRF